MKKNRETEKRFRELQAANSRWAQSKGQKSIWVKIALVALTGVVMFGVYSTMFKLPSTPPKVLGHEELVEKNEQGLVQAGLSLTNVGAIILHEPRHEVCGTRLFFVESAASFDKLTPHLKHGVVLSKEPASDFEECCNRCSESSCHGFRFRKESCALLQFDHDDLPVENEEDLERSISRLRAQVNHRSNAKFQHEDDEEELGKDILAERNIDDAKDLENTAKEILENKNQEDTQKGSSDVDVDETIEFDFDTEKNDEDDDQGNDFSEENLQHEDSLEKSESQQDESEEEEQVGLNEQEEEQVEESQDEFVEEEVSAEPALESATPNGEQPLEDFGFSFDLDTFQGGEELPELEQVNHDGEGALSQSDKELMDQLLGNMLPGSQPKAGKKVDGEDDENSESEAEVESTAEDKQDDATNLEMGKTKIKEVIPLGDYARLTARDEVYIKHRNTFLRYRTNKEIQAVSIDFANSFKDVSYVPFGKSGDKKKPQPLMSLRVGNGRRGKHVFVVATLRGCEWTSALAVLHTAMVLKGRWESTRQLLDSVQFHFISIANPDGFDFSHHKTPTTARSWCKNRRVAVPGYHGVDLEKNWGIDGVSWGFGKRDGAKLDSFQGPTNFSEPETRALRDYMSHYATGRGRVALLHVKCCSGIITPPLVYKTENQGTINTAQVAALMARHVERTDGSKYTVESPKPFGPKDTGGMVEYMHNEALVDHAYTFEVKGVGLATRADHAKISVDPFQTLLRELETATVFTALRLLQMPIEGPAVDEPFEPSTSTVELVQQMPSSSSKKKRKSKKT